MAASKDNKQVDQELLALLQTTEDALAAFPRGDYPDLVPQVDRADRVLAFARLIISDSDRGLVPASARAIAAQALTNLREDTGAALAPPGEIDNLLDALVRFPASRGRDAQQATVDIAQEFQRSTKERLRSIHGKATATQNEMQKQQLETAEGVKALKAALDVRTGEIDQRVTDLHASMDNARNAVDGLVRDEQQRFTEEKEERERLLTEFYETQERELLDIRNRQQAAGDEHVDELGGQAKRAREFMDIVTSTGTQGAYQDRANKDETQAGRYRVTAIAIGLGAVALATALFLFGDKGEYQLAKLGVVTTTLLVAGLVWRFANSKQETAEGRREQELKLASFQAVLETLPPEKVPEQICWFFRQQYARDAEPAQGDGGALRSLLRRLPPAEQDRDAA